MHLSKEGLDALRKDLTGLARSGSSLESISHALVEHLRSTLKDEKGEPALALVRFFKTHVYSDLPPDLQRFADRWIPEGDRPEWLRCLTLLATDGDEPRWKDRKESAAHQAVPLLSEEMVLGAPMIAQLIREFGLSITAVVNPAPDLIVQATATYGIFHIPEAQESPHIPAQEEFVKPYGIHSVLGFGGLLPNADLWTIIMFSRLPISKETAASFRRIASGLTVTLIPFVEKTFTETPAPQQAGSSTA